MFFFILVIVILLDFGSIFSKNHKMPHKRRRTASNVEIEAPQLLIQSPPTQLTSLTDVTQDCVSRHIAEKYGSVSQPS
jgi:hypothetical protein